MRNKKGFTLVELMIVVSIIGIMAATGGPAILGYLEIRGLREAANRLHGDLQLAKQEAIKRNANCTLTFTNVDYTNSLTNMAVDLTQYRGRVRFGPDPATTAAGSGTITFRPDAWSSSGAVYLYGNAENRTKPRRLRVTVAGGISQHIWDPTSSTWLRP